jgi:AcrR family transcriptional regulator
MARRVGEERREEILRSAIEVVRRRGLARTRVADVAERLGVSTSLVFYHFATKDRLLSEALLAAAEHDLARLDRAVRSRGTAARRLRSVLRLYGPTGDTSPGWTLDIESWGEALRCPELRVACRRVDQRWQDAIAVVITEGVVAGEFRCPDPVHSAERIAAMLDGLAVATQVRRTVPRSRAAHWALIHAAFEVGVAVEVLTGSTERLPGGCVLDLTGVGDGSRPRGRQPTPADEAVAGPLTGADPAPTHPRGPHPRGD